LVAAKMEPDTATEPAAKRIGLAGAEQTATPRKNDRQKTIDAPGLRDGS
jgi:hypothetical protein